MYTNNNGMDYVDKDKSVTNKNVIQQFEYAKCGP